MVDCLVLAPGGLAAGAIRRPGPLQYRALKPERDELVVSGAACGLRLDQPEPLAGGKRLVQKLVALDQGSDRTSSPTSSSRIERNEVELPRRGGVGLKRRSAHRSEVLDGSAVAGAERDELSIEDDPLGAAASGARSEPS